MTVRGWQDHEREIAEMFGLERSITSGNKFYSPGDATTPGRASPFPIYAECKFTRHGSFSLKLKEMLQDEEQAAALGKRFLMPIRFSPGWPFVGEHDYVVLKAHDLAELLDLLRGDHARPIG